jgi:hypothetical protein
MESISSASDARLDQSGDASISSGRCCCSLISRPQAMGRGIAIAAHHRSAVIAVVVGQQHHPLGEFISFWPLSNAGAIDDNPGGYFICHLLLLTQAALRGLPRLCSDPVGD